MNRDDQLAELLREAVSGIEPGDRLHRIHARTSAARRPTTILAVSGAVLASAAAVVAVAVLGTGVLGPAEPGPAGGSSASSPTGSITSDGTSPDETPAAVRAVAVYYLGDTADGVRLYREFRSVSEADHGPAESIGLLMTTPRDPDYRTLWPADAFAGGSVGSDRITVELSDTSLLARPAGMTEDEARASLQQVVYTLQAYAQERLPVELTVGGDTVDRVLGVPTSEPVVAAPALDVLSHMNLTTPEEGATVGDGTLEVTGVGNGYEGTVAYQVQRGSETLKRGAGIMQGAYGNRLYPFELTVPVGGLPPGSYTLVVTTDDPSGGEGIGAMTDDRQFTVE